MFRHLQSPIHFPSSQVSGRSLPSHEGGGGFSCFQGDQPVFLHPSPSCLQEVSLPDAESAHQGAHPSSQGEAGTGRSRPWGQPPWGSGGEGPGTWAEPGLCGSWACTPRAEVGPGSCLWGKGADGKSRPSWSWCVAPPSSEGVTVPAPEGSRAGDGEATSRGTWLQSVQSVRQDSQ